MAKSDNNDDGDTLDDSIFDRRSWSPVCSYCRWWDADPDKWRRCNAYPKRDIPNAIWNGQNYHLTPYGGEVKHNGQPPVFAPVPKAKLPAKLKDAYERAHPKA